MSHLTYVLLLSLSVIGASRNGLAMPATQAAASGLAGRWEGAVDVGGTKLPCAVVFSDTANGLTATIDVQGIKKQVRRRAGRIDHATLKALGVAAPQSREFARSRGAASAAPVLPASAT